MDDTIKEAFQAVCFKPPTKTAEMAGWAEHIKLAEKSLWTVFPKIGLTNKQIVQFLGRYREGLSNHQRKQWCDYEKQFQTEIRYIISLC
jgi:hypothetical protein